MVVAVSDAVVGTVPGSATTAADVAGVVERSVAAAGLLAVTGVVPFVFAVVSRAVAGVAAAVGPAPVAAASGVDALAPFDAPPLLTLPDSVLFDEPATRPPLAGAEPVNGALASAVR